ncbi:MAG: helix-turn-helix transcriptional regulator [Ilumatobacteraceae bacterium]|nr:helix-turn-helix transcriptional regulator [Ilumatobacteraceae bacterium]
MITQPDQEITWGAGFDHVDRKVRPTTMTGVLEFVRQSRQAFHVLRLPQTTIVAANAAAVELYGESADVIIGRHASSLFRGADQVHAAVALSALAAGAIDSYCVECRSAIATSGVKARLCVRRFDVEGAQFAVAMTVPVDQQRPLGAVEEAFATAKGIGWVSTSPTLRTTRSVGSGSGQVAESVFAVLDRLSARQREIVAALLRGERTSETAASMFLSKSTVRSHLSAIFNQFGVHSQTELLVLLRSQNAGRSTSN